MRSSRCGSPTAAVAWSKQLTPGDEFNLSCSRGAGLPRHGLRHRRVGRARATRRTAPSGCSSGRSPGSSTGSIRRARGELVWQARVGAGGINGGVLWGLASDGRNVYAAVSDLGRRARDRRRPRSTGGRTASIPTRAAASRRCDIADGARAWYRGAGAMPAGAGRLQPRAAGGRDRDSGRRALGRRRRPSARVRGATTDACSGISTPRASSTTVNGVPGRGGSLDGAGPVVAGGMVYTTSGYARNGGMAGQRAARFRRDAAERADAATSAARCSPCCSRRRCTRRFPTPDAA